MQSSGLWERIWGEHMHHGYYPGGVGSSMQSNRDAQGLMIEESRKWAGGGGGERAEVSSMVDGGCGIGGSSRYIHRKFDCEAVGITLSPEQCARANTLVEQQGLDPARVKYQVGDALAMPFASDSFDLVWSMESGEHMPDKKRFVEELTRVCKPGGTVLLVTWCHRDLAAQESELQGWEKSLLDLINAAYYLPAWCSVADYVDLFQQQGMEQLQREDWSEEVSPFWLEVIKTALQPEGMLGLLQAGPQTARGAAVMPLMSLGYQLGLIKFGLVSAVKPKQ